jgi:hypothetical protein
MNLIDFHKHPDNAKYCSQSDVYFNCQGNVNRFARHITGNGHNRYTFDVVDESTDQKLQIVFEESLIQD